MEDRKYSCDDEVQIIDVKRKATEKNLRVDWQCSSGKCSICLEGYDNKSFLNKCNRILLTSEI